MRTLFVSSQRPHPPNAGGRQRTHLLITALRRCGPVDLFLLDDPGHISNEDRKVLERDFNLVGAAGLRGMSDRGVWKILKPLRPGLVDRLAREFVGFDCSYKVQRAAAIQLSRVARASAYDVVVGRYLLPMVQSGAFELGLPTVVDVDDVELQLCRERLQTGRISRLERLMLVRALRKLEENVPVWTSKAAHIWLSSASDLENANHRKVSILPNVPFFNGSVVEDISTPDESRSQSVLVVGHLGWPANIRVIDWFIETVWSRIRESAPAVELRIVGGSLRRRLAEKWRKSPGVTVVGYVDDLTSEYQNTTVVVAPIIDGGGTKIKVLESLQYRRPAVVTVQALRGYERVLRHGESLLVADDPAQFADSVIRLLGDPDLRKRLANAGASMVAQHFSKDAFVEEVHRTIERLELA